MRTSIYLMVTLLWITGGCTRAPKQESTDPPLGMQPPAGMARLRAQRRAGALSAEARRIEKLLLDMKHCTIVRTEAVQHIDHGCKAYHHLIKAWGKTRNTPVRKELGRLGLKHLRHQSPAVRRGALLFVSLHDKAQLRRVLQHAARETDAFVLGQILHDLRQVVATSDPAARLVLRLADHRDPVVRKAAAATLVKRSGVKGFALKFLTMMRTEPNRLVRSYLLSWGRRLTDEKTLLSVYEECSKQPTDRRVYSGCMAGLVALWNPLDRPQAGQAGPRAKGFALFVQRVQKNHGCAQCPPLTGVSRELGRIPPADRNQDRLVPLWYRREPVVKVLRHTVLSPKAPYQDRNLAIRSLAQLKATDVLKTLTASLGRQTSDRMAKRLTGVVAQALGGTLPAIR